MPEFITTKQVLEILGISNTTLYEVRKRRSDFPKPRKLLPGSPNRYVKSEIMEFLGGV